MCGCNSFISDFRGGYECDGVIWLGVFFFAKLNPDDGLYRGNIDRGRESFVQTELVRVTNVKQVTNKH
jgi:hypothetical protein